MSAKASRKVVSATDTRKITDQTIHHQVDKYDIANYIYFNYNNWNRTGLSADYGMGSVSATLKTRTEAIIAEQEEIFKSKMGMSSDEFLKQMGDNAAVLKAFEQIFTGGKKELGEIFSLKDLREAKSQNTKSVKEIMDYENIFSVGFLNANNQEALEIGKFLKSSADLSTNLYTLMNCMQDSKYLNSMNNIFSTGMSVQLNADGALLYEVLKGTYKELTSMKGLAQIGSTKTSSTKQYNRTLTDYFNNTLGSKIKSVSKTVTDSVDKMGEILDKLSQGETVTSQEITNAYRGLQKTLGINSELIGTMETRVLGKYLENQVENLSKDIPMALGTAMSTGTEVNHSALANAKLIINGKVLDARGNFDLSNFAGINKTADTTITYTDGETAAFSQKRYNPYSAYSIQLTSRHLINLLAYLADGDPGLQNFGNTELFFNAMYFGLGGISYSQRTHSTRSKKSSAGEEYNKLVRITPAKVNEDHNQILFNFALRIYLDYFSTNKQAMFNINGRLIPAPTYAKIATQNIINSFGGEDQGKYSVSRSVSFAGKYFLDKKSDGTASTSNERLKKLLTSKEIIDRRGSRTKTRAQAADRNSAAKTIILGTQVTLRMPYITVDQYRNALSNNSQK